jgi:hypothetical protein
MGDLPQPGPRGRLAGVGRVGVVRLERRAREVPGRLELSNQPVGRHLGATVNQTPGTKVMDHTARIGRVSPSIGLFGSQTCVRWKGIDNDGTGETDSG